MLARARSCPRRLLKPFKLDLIIAGPCSRNARAAARLAEPAELLNQRLCEHMSGFSPAVINQFDLGAAEGASNRNPASESALARHRRALAPAPDAGDFLAADLEIDDRQARHQAVTRPAFLLRSPRPGEIRALAEACHRSAALATPVAFPTVHYPAKTAKLALEISGLLAGRLHRGPEGPRVAPPCQTRMHAIFTPDPDAFDRLPELAPDLLERCLLIGEPPPVPEADPAVSGARHGFAQAFRSALSAVLGTRRQGQDPAFALTPGAVDSFDRHLRSYELECDMLPAEPGVSARGLPITLVWAMGMLAPHLPGAGLAEKAMIETAFAVSRRLLARHVATCRRLRASGVVAAQLRLAGRIVEEVRAHAPLRQRDLVRSFHRQAKDRFDRMEPGVGMTIRIRTANPTRMSFLPGSERFRFDCPQAPEVRRIGRLSALGESRICHGRHFPGPFCCAP